MSRLDDLQDLREGLIARMAECGSDQNYAVLGRLLRDVVKDISELDSAGDGETKRTGLSEFEKRLAERESSPANARRAKSS